MRLVEAIWDSIAADTSALPVDAELIQARLADYRSDRDRGESADGIVERIRRSL